jgi:hypothetical protein
VANELEGRRLELRYQLAFRVLEVASKALDSLIPGIVGIFIVYFGIYRPVHDLAGRQSLTDFRFRLFADVKPDELVSYVFGIVGWVFGLNAQRLRRNTTERLTNRIQELERRIDPDRSTSGLTTRGKTPAEVK